jgi:hypothetical protein
MLSNVSWSEFVIAVVALLIIYYLVIGIGYLRGDAAALLSKLQKKNDPAEGRPEIRSDTFTGGSEGLAELEDIVADLKYSVLEKAGRNPNKEELLTGIVKRLRHYSGLGKPAYRVALNNYIIWHTNDLCGITLTDEELHDRWNALSR